MKVAGLTITCHGDHSYDFYSRYFLKKALLTRNVRDGSGDAASGFRHVLRTGSMGHLSKSPTTISKISSNFGKIGLKKMLGGVVLPPRTLFSPGVSFSQWTSQ